MTWLKVLLLLVWCSSTFASEVVKIYNPYSPAHNASPALFRIVDEANTIQSTYKFTVEFRPGGNQIIAVKSLDENSLAIIAPAYVENVESGKLVESDYAPVYAFGDACWAVITNKPVSGQSEFVVGGVGFGNASHLTALALGEKYKFDVLYIVFKSNNDALINMAGDNGIEFVIDKYESYTSLKAKNPKMQMIAASCPNRLPQEPKIKTLKELGIDAPYIFNIAVALRTMPERKRKELGTILTMATQNIGEREIFNLSAMRPPQFDGITVEDFYAKSVRQIKFLQTKYRDKINNR